MEHQDLLNFFGSLIDDKEDQEIISLLLQEKSEEAIIDELLKSKTK